MRYKKLMIGLCIFIALTPNVSIAWFGEAAAKQEALELEFRETFILLIYYLLYGTVMGVPLGHGLLEIFENLRGLVLMNPPLNHDLIYHVIRYFIIVLEPLYVTTLLVTGIYLMFLSGSPKGRRKAKLLFPRLIASMVAVTLSLQILQIMFGVSYGLSENILDNSGVEINAVFMETIDSLVILFSASTLTTFEGGHMFLLLIFFLVMGLFSILTLRYIILSIFTLIFPLGIFLYTFKISRGVGRFILEQAILWTFLQVVISLLIVVANIGVTLFGLTGDLRTIAGVMAFLMVITSPMMLITLIKKFLP